MSEILDTFINKATFDLELFYDMKPAYYTFTGERKKLDRHFKEIKNE